jgi:predicted DNA repair protein MutK
LATGFFALLDDIAVLMDDVAVTSKVAAEKTAGILGDDLAVVADQASGFKATRELPVLWAIAKGSFVNKLIILPIAFLLTAFLPEVIIPILMLGGIYLAYEGVEKIYEYFFHHEDPKRAETLRAMSQEEILNEEQSKIKSAIITDFILSIEIVILALSTVATQTLPIQITVVSFIAILATIGVYGIVALIVRMDDFGYKLIEIGEAKKHNGTIKIGQMLVAALPKVIRSLAVIGTLAMLLVAGGIYLHNVEKLHHIFHALPSLLSEFLIGLWLGVVALIVMMIISEIRSLFKK